MNDTTNRPELRGGSVALTTAPAEDWSPRVDIVEMPEEYRVEVELPGVPPEAIDVDLQNGLLQIQGKIEPRPEDGRTARVRELNAGTYSRTLRLGDSIDAARITAEGKDGLLMLRLPKVSAVKPRVIPVVKSS